MGDQKGVNPPPATSGRLNLVKEGFLSYGVALTCVALATWVRLLLDPLVGNQFPFATLLLAILLTAWLRGFLPALFAVLLGAFAADYFLLPIRGKFDLVGPDQYVGLALYSATGLGIAMLGGIMRRAQHRAATDATAACRQVALLNQSYDAILVWDWQGPIRFWNRGAERLYGISQADALGQLSQTLLRTQAQAGTADFTEELEHAGYWEGELEQTTPDGRQLIVESRMVLIRESEPAYVIATNRDISKRRAAEVALREANAQLEARVQERTHELARSNAALRESEELFRLAVVGVQDYSILRLDPAGHIASWNAGAEIIKGWQAEEILGQHFSLFYPAEDQALGKPDKHLEAALAAGRYEDEGWRVRKNGQRYWVNVIITPIYSEDGQLRGFSKVARDMTQRRKAEQDRRESEARVSGIVNAAMDAIISVDSRYQIVLFNAAAEQMFRCSAEQALGQSLEMFLPSRYRAQHAQHIQTFSETGVTARSMGSLGMISGLRADGEEFPIEASISQIEVADEKIFTVILRDITERNLAEQILRESEENFRALVEATTQAVWSVTPDGESADIPEWWAKLTGQTQAESAGLGWLEKVHPDDRETARAGWVEAFARQSLLDLEYRLLTQTDGYRHFAVKGVPVFHQDGSLRLWIGTFDDVTEIRRAEQALLESEILKSAVLNSVSSHIAVVDRDGVIIAVNEAWRRFARENPAPGELVSSLEEGANYLEICWRAAESSPQAQAVWEGIQEILVGKWQSFTLEYDCHSPEEERWFTLSATPLVTPQGGAVISHTNITERKRAEEEVRRNRAQLEAVFQAIQDGLVVTDMTGQFLLVNQAEARICGFASPAEMLQQLDYFVQIFELFTLEGDPLPIEQWPISRILRGEHIQDWELRGRRRDTGQEWIFSYSGEPVYDKQGAQILAVVVTRDITERKRAEAALAKEQERLSNIATASPSVIYSFRVTPQGKASYTYVSPAFSELYGVTPEEVYEDARCSDAFVHPEDFPHLVKSINRSSRDLSRWHFVWRVIHPRNGERWVEGYAAPLREADGSTLWHGILNDVTERKRAEASLREKETQLYEADRRLAEIVQGMTEACFALDADWRFTFVNDRGETLLRHRRDEMLGRSIWDVFYKLLGTPMEKQYRRVMAERVPASFEAYSPVAERWLDVRLFPSGDGLAAFLLDIHERKLAEAERQKFISLAKNSLEFIGMCDLAGVPFFINDAGLQLVGLDNLAQGLNTPVTEFFFPEDQALISEQFLPQVGREGHGELEIRFRHFKTGQALWMIYHVFVIKGENGQPEGFATVSRDITARKQAEKEIRQLNAVLEQRVLDRTNQLEAANRELQRSRTELQSLFESLPGLYLILTPALTIVGASDAYLKATMTARESILGRNLFDVFPDNPDDLGATGETNLRASLDRVRQSGKPDTMAIQKYDIRRPDGVFEERYWSPINSPLLGVDQKIDYIIHRVEDVTDFVRQRSQPTGTHAELQARMEKMQAEIFQSSQQVQAAYQQLAIVNKELEAFSYSVSHDLRAPLRHINGFSQILLEDYAHQLDEEGRSYLQEVRNASVEMAQLIDDLLELSRVTRREIQKEVFPLSELVHTVVAELTTREPGRQVRCQVAEGLSAYADKRLVGVVLRNLLGNAWKFTAKREQAEIVFGLTEKNGEKVYFVRDNGAGFDMNYADKLFGAFQRLHSSKEFEGSGVGLATVQRVIRRHGGQVWAEGAVNQGATFYFTLPGMREVPHGE